METTYQGSTGAGIGLRAGAITLLYLGGGLVLGFGVAFAASNVPIHIAETTKNIGAALLLLAFLGLASLLWGRRMARLAGIDDPRVAQIGGISWVIALFIVALIASDEVGVFDGVGIPIHVLYGLIFVPACFAIVGTVSLAWGWALRDGRLGGKLLLQAALPAAAAYMLAYLAMDAWGYRVGAPGAAERATMITVTFVGALAAAFVGGAGLGIGLSRAGEGRMG